MPTDLHEMGSMISKKEVFTKPSSSLPGVAALIVLSTAALAQNRNISTDLLSVDPNSRVDVIVQYTHTPTTKNHADISAMGGSLKRELRSVKAASYSLPAASLSALTANPEVAFISVDRKVHTLLDNTTAAVNAAAAWSAGLDGTGIGVAVIDSGISEHDDLQGSNGSRIVFRESFIGGDTNDHFGHGEHVAGIIAGNGADSNCATCIRHIVG